MVTTTKLLPGLRPRRTAKPTWQVENAIWREGFARVAGVDEVGIAVLGRQQLSVAQDAVFCLVSQVYTFRNEVGTQRGDADAEVDDCSVREHLCGSFGDCGSG